ncbi:MAG: GNAT family N-acetyltransferase [Clostridia bacterium]|nr:GNAT family N-acetyltransferase [Clostridia bacterium]
MTNEQIWEIALKQSAYDCGCAAEDFFSGENIVTVSKSHPRARKYLPLPFECDMVTYGSGIIAQTSERLAGVVREYINKYPTEHAFETPHIHALDEMLAPYGLKVCFMAEYFLPDVNKIKALPCKYELRMLHNEDFENLYTPDWSNALCKKRKELDVLGVGAYDGEKLVGLAGCSADCDDMYQIGVDVLPEYRRQGIAAALTSRLALEILALDKVPFYCAAWCNIKSVRNAVKCGFAPAWAELTARDIYFVDSLNKEK